MEIRKLIPTFMVQDIQHSIEYYKTFFHFELVQVIPDTEPFEWARMKCGAVEFALEDQETSTADIPEIQELKTASTIRFHVEVDDVETLYNELKDKVEISQLLFTFSPGIAEFRMRDCNGYFWTFEGKVDK